MQSPIFIDNQIFSGKKAGDVSYYLQNVMASQRRPSRPKHGTLAGAYSGVPALSMVSLEEYERRKYGRSDREARERQKRQQQDCDQWNKGPWPAPIRNKKLEEAEHKAAETKKRDGFLKQQKQIGALQSSGFFKNEETSDVFFLVFEHPVLGFVKQILRFHFGKKTTDEARAIAAEETKMRIVKIHPVTEELAKEMMGAVK